MYKSSDLNFSWHFLTKDLKIQMSYDQFPHLQNSWSSYLRLPQQFNVEEHQLRPYLKHNSRPIFEYQFRCSWSLDWPWPSSNKAFHFATSIWIGWSSPKISFHFPITLDLGPHVGFLSNNSVSSLAISSSHISLFHIQRKLPGIDLAVTFPKSWPCSIAIWLRKSIIDQ